MPKTILVPLDGSALAERAAAYATALAEHLDAHIVLIRAVLTVHPRSRDERFNAEASAAAEQELSTVGMSCRQKVPTEWLVWQDEAGWAIVEAAKSKNADLIVMSTHGRSGLGRWLYGSVADRVLRTADGPIILVPPGARDDWEAAKPFRVVIALDGSALGEQALGPALELARAMGGEVHLVVAMDPPYYWVSGDAYSAYDPSVEFAAARKYLDGVAERARATGLTVSAEVTWGPPDRVVLDAARAIQAHLIALATHGRGGLARLAMGSVTQGVLHRTRVPLLIVRPAEVRESVKAGARPERPRVSPEAPLALLLTAREATVARAALAHFAEDASQAEQDLRTARDLLNRVTDVLDSAQSD